jgi:hypothetical protein
MCKDEFECDGITALYNIANLDPFKLLQSLEESHCYAISNVEMREKFIKEEMRHLWKDEKICISSSKKYIKQMKKEIKVFQERAKILSYFIHKIRSGEFTEKEDEKAITEGEQLYQDMIALYER